MGYEMGQTWIFAAKVLCLPLTESQYLHFYAYFYAPLGAFPSLGTQPRYEAPGDLGSNIHKTQWLTSGD